MDGQNWNVLKNGDIILSTDFICVVFDRRIILDALMAISAFYETITSKMGLPEQREILISPHTLFLEFDRLRVRNSELVVNCS